MSTWVRSLSPRALAAWLEEPALGLAFLEEQLPAPGERDDLTLVEVLVADAGLTPEELGTATCLGDWRELPSAVRGLLEAGVEHGEDVGYGPARYLEPAVVERCARADTTLTDWFAAAARARLAVITWVS